MESHDRRTFLKGLAGASIAAMSPSLVLGCGDDAAGDDATAQDGVAGDIADTGQEVGALPDTPSDTPEELVEPTGTLVHAILGEELGEVYDMGRAAAKALGFVDGALAGKTVFIKPNFVTLGLELFGVAFDPHMGECTKPELVAAVAEQCLEAGAAKVVIGEGAQKDSWDWSTLSFLEGNAIEGVTDLGAAVARLATIYGSDAVALQCLNGVDEWVAIPTASSHDYLADGFFVAKAFAEADHVISLPVMKTHTWALVTASMKNYVGVTPSNIHGNGISRCKLHLAYAHESVHGEEEAGVSGAFVDIHAWRKAEGKQDYAIVDGTICLEGTGPHTAPVNDGITIHMKDRNALGRYFLLASDDLVAADATATRLMGIPTDDVKALRMARVLDLGEQDEVTLVGATLDDLKIPDWQLPVMESEDYFAGFCPDAER